MNSTLYFTYDGDAYELELDDAKNLRFIWRYRNNKPGHPELVVYAHIEDEELRDKVDSKLISHQ